MNEIMRDSYLKSRSDQLVEAQKAIEEWQDISTAPKTGGRQLLGNHTGPEILVTDGENIHIAFWNGRSWDDGDWHNDLGIMLYWMPLPELPKHDSV